MLVFARNDKDMLSDKTAEFDAQHFTSSQGLPQNIGRTNRNVTSSDAPEREMPDIDRDGNTGDFRSDATGYF